MTIKHTGSVFVHKYANEQEEEIKLIKFYHPGTLQEKKTNSRFGFG